MKFDLKKPCDNCPFRRAGGVRLTRDRVVEIAQPLLEEGGGHTFACHKTLDQPEHRHCAGALLFSAKHGVLTQAGQIASRLGLYRPEELTGHDQVFDSLEEMMDSCIGREQ